MTLSLRPYQIEGRDFLAARKHALLADEMRVGKTPQAILAAAKVGAKNILVVCPAIAVPHWRREFLRWWPDSTPPNARVLSYDRAKLDWPTLRQTQWDVGITDEAHFAKNPVAKRTKLVYGKEGMGWFCDRLWALSGTPAPKHAGELWPMLYAFGVVDMTYQEFVRRYCRIDYLSQRPIGTKEAHIPELRALLARVMLRRKRKDVAPDMPEIGFDFLEVRSEQPADILVPAGLQGDALAAWAEAHAVGDREDRQAVASAKIKPLADEIAFALDNDLLNRTVVFGWHVKPLLSLVGALTIRDLRVGLITGATAQGERERVQRGFRDGTIQVVCANILAAGLAIDLSAASHGYMLELDWVSGNNIQAANRLISMEKVEPVTIDVVTCPGTVDDRVQKVLLQRVRELSKIY